MNRLLPLVMLPLLIAARGDKPPQAVRRALDAKTSKAATAALEKGLKGASKTEEPWILLYLGEERRLAGDRAAAREAFEKVAGDFPGSGAKDAAILGMAVVDAGDQAGGNVLATLELIGDKGVPATLNADRYLLIAKVRAQEGKEGEADRHLRKAAKYASGDKEVARRVQRAGAELRTLAEEVADTGEQDGDRPRDLVAIERVRAALAEQRWDDVPGLVGDFHARFEGSPFVAEAGYALKRAEARVAPEPTRVAVLLPLSGSYAIPGGNLRTAIELGNQRSGGKLSLVFHDTTGAPEGCVKALEQAVLTEGAGVVIGPLLKEEALLCAPVAQALRVPMLTLTSSEEVLAAGDQVFRAFPSTEQQVEVLLREAYDKRGLTRFAILHPSNAFGENAARVFETSVLARGGTIAAKVPYAPDQKDFRSVGKTLGRKDYKARANEFARLKNEATRNQQDPDKVTLPPLIDYDAIFIPDGYARVALLASALAFEEFPVGKFRPKRDVTPLPLLGINSWNNDDLARRGGAYVQDSIFVDAFDPRKEQGAVAEFVAAWRDRGDGEPTVVEAVGYDTARLVAAAVADRPADVAAALHEATLPDPVAGTIGFGDDNQLDRDWSLLTVGKDGVVPLQPPDPREPEAPR